MKKLLAAVIMLAGISASYAADYGSAGCGLGSMLFKENDMSQILAATTNGTSANQTFAMTSGTLNCNNKGLVKVAMARQSYIEANYKQIAKEASWGKGEYVNNLAYLYGYTGEKTAEFASLLQKNYDKIFASNDAAKALNEINRLTSN
ncbi:MAG: DUF3015 family protein [Elusimicrobia bacterium]|nr:DUF3015 family protein [Elusimicrobiota bacterium]